VRSAEKLAAWLMKKIAVVLLNLGGPDSKEAIRPFLFNFFMDKNIIRAPLPVRFLVATMISRNRSKNEAGSSYAALGNKSPLLENSQAQAEALEKSLNAKGIANFKTFVSMRYWHPVADDVMSDVRNWYADQYRPPAALPAIFDDDDAVLVLSAWEIALRAKLRRECIPTAQRVLLSRKIRRFHIAASASRISSHRLYEQRCHRDLRGKASTAHSSCRRTACPRT
jgi:hypothetical protein